MYKVNEVSIRGIPMVSRMLSRGITGNVDIKRMALSSYLDDSIVNLLSDDLVLCLFDIISSEVEKTIRDTIKEDTGEVPVAEGTKVKLLCNLGPNPKGSIQTIDKVGRFEENTFGKGWYYYDIASYRVYRGEFEVITEDTDLSSISNNL